MCIRDSRKYNELYRAADGMLEQVLSEERIEISGLEEGRLSALAAKCLRVQEKLNLEIGRAQEEKEQVKQLISDMSHQLKTPLANVLLYVEILCRQELPEGRRQDFLEKLRRQTEKIDWLTASLFKMVKLEQGVICLLYTSRSAGGCCSVHLLLCDTAGHQYSFQRVLVFHHGGDCGCDGGLYDPQGGKGYGGNGRRGPAFQPEGA